MIKAKNNIYWNHSEHAGAYTLMDGDVIDWVKLNLIDINSETDVNIILPDDTVNIPRGVPFKVRGMGVGLITIVGDVGVTVQGSVFTTVNQYDSFELAKIGDNLFAVL